jgi:hypothetical protein
MAESIVGAKNKLVYLIIDRPGALLAGTFVLDLAGLLWRGGV